MAIVYQHRRLDSNEVFYVGIGKTIKRAYSTNHRNAHWKNIVNKAGYTIEILFDNLTWEESCQKEIELIKQYGRDDLNEGTLVNMTDGGDGVIGHKHDKNTKDKIGLASKKFLTGRKLNYDVWNKGKKIPQQTKKKISENSKGKVPWNKGKSMSEDQKNKLSSYFKLNPIKYWKGKNRSEETKEKIRQTLLNKKNKNE